MRLVSRSPEETENIGKHIGNWAKQLCRDSLGGVVLLLDGELGMGKTVLARGLARGLGITERITSPTYSIIQEYTGSPGLIHVDLYRIHDADELVELGIEELQAESGSILLVEWAKRVPADSFGPAYQLSIEAGESAEERILILADGIPAPGEQQ